MQRKAKRDPSFKSASDGAPSKYATTQFNHFIRCQSRVRELNSAYMPYSRQLTYTHAEIRARVDRELYQFNSYKRLTSYYRAQIHGMLTALLDASFRFQVWVHIDLATGIAYPSGHADLDGKYLEIGTMPDKWESCTAWACSMDLAGRDVTGALQYAPTPADKIKRF